jgi:hypothetical protein
MVSNNCFRFALIVVLIFIIYLAFLTCKSLNQIGSAGIGKLETCEPPTQGHFDLEISFEPYFIDSIFFPKLSALLFYFQFLSHPRSRFVASEF